MQFDELKLDERILKAIGEHSFSSLTKCQESVLPHTLSGKDVMVQSKTGSGKTLCYLLTIFQKYVMAGGKEKALVIAPTRELAVQIENDAKSFSKYIDGYSVGCFYGGVGYQRQNKELDSALVVGTPGRLLDFRKSGKLDFSAFDIIVLDEADRMFDMGFYPDIQEVFRYSVNSKERQTMLFSATLSVKVQNLAWQYMNEPMEIHVEPEEITVKNIVQELFHVSKEEKFPLLLSLLHKTNPSSAIIFTNTKEKTVEVSDRLALNGYKSKYLMGDMEQKKRLRTLEELKKGEITILVATDVAARGLQIDDLELVVNYDIPEDYENYVHRIGRTARAGKSGKAITLACEEYIYGLEAIEDYIQMKIPVLWADECGLEPVEDKSKDYRPPRRYSKRDDRIRKTPLSAAVRPSGRKDRERRVPQRKDKKYRKEYKKSLPKEEKKLTLPEGKDLKKVRLSSIPVQKEEKGFFSFIRRLFSKEK